MFPGISRLFMFAVVWQELCDVSVFQVQSYVASLLYCLVGSYSLNLICYFFQDHFVDFFFSSIFVIRTVKMFCTYLKMLTVIWIAGSLLSS